MEKDKGSRVGRPKASERAQRRADALDAALAQLLEGGYDSLSMSAVAARAGSSKESLYGWFGSKEALLAELIEAQADRTNSVVEQALRDPEAEPREVLIRVATGLLTLLLGRASLALNRAAMDSPQLADILLRRGRYTTGPLIARYLEQIGATAGGGWSDADASFRAFYGLVVQDSQIRALLGEPPPSNAEIRQHGEEAVRRFLLLADRE